MNNQKWYEKSGPEGDVIISTRIRFARNLREFPFPSRMSHEQREKLICLTEDALLKSNSSISDLFVCRSLSDISQLERISLVERYLVSPEFISRPDGRAVFILQDESVSIMVNEEDHIRLQVMHEGFDFESALSMADRIDTLLNESLHFAFDPNLGYLTQCPTNLGTGMRASLMLHLPALQENGTIAHISENLAKLGLTMRGTYGEASRPIGALYQLSNQITLGLSEQEAIDNLRNIAMQLVRLERTAREEMLQKIEVQDAISRSIGLLKSAKLLSNDEFMKLISNVRLGIGAGFIKDIQPEMINGLLIHMQPATLQLPAGNKLSPAERDTLRASLVAKAFS